VADSFHETLAKLHPSLGASSKNSQECEHPFQLGHADPTSHRSKFLLKTAAAEAEVAIDLEGFLPPPTHRVDQYLHRMPEMTSVIKGALYGQKPAFEDVSIVLVHHLTAEVLGTIAALRALGCRDLVTVFVGYNEDAEKAYHPDLADLPDHEFRCFILASTTTSGSEAEGTYRVARSFTKAPEGEDNAYDALDAAMKNKGMDFLKAMRCLAVHTALKQLSRAKSTGKKCLVIEDGGYLTPILNRAALDGQTIAELRASQSTPTDRKTDERLPKSVKELLETTMIGSIEHTRNGYDQDMRVNIEYGKLATPVFTIAVSYLKTQVESDIVAESILNASTSVLYSHGYVLKRRNVLVFGSRGNIGRRLMRHLTDRLENAEVNLVGCDLKVGDTDSATELPKWQTNPQTSSVPECLEKGTYAEFDIARMRDLDVIIGVTGGPTPGHPVLQVKDVVDWLLKGKKRDLYIASGSSKTDEFPELIGWMNELLSGNNNEINGNQATIEKSEIKDAISGRDFGSQYTLSIKLCDGKWHTKNLLFLNNLMPVNFLFYGVPTEVIDEVLAQIVSAAVTLRRKASSLEETRLYAVDFDRIASLDVYRSRPPSYDISRPLPAKS
jgi:hypothetical protein